MSERVFEQIQKFYSASTPPLGVTEVSVAALAINVEDINTNQNTFTAGDTTMVASYWPTSTQNLTV
jgi:hypothetical protein